MAVSPGRVTLLVEDLALGERAAVTLACRIAARPPADAGIGPGQTGGRGAAPQQPSMEGTGLAVSVDETSAVVSVGLTLEEASVGSTMLIDYTLQRDHTKQSRARSLDRLRRLLDEEPDQLDDRGCRHALMYVLEGKEPGLRARRLQLLRESLHVAAGARARAQTPKDAYRDTVS